jgi:hypothetical protein
MNIHYTAISSKLWKETLSGGFCCNSPFPVLRTGFCSRDASALCDALHLRLDVSVTIMTAAVGLYFYQLPVSRWYGIALVGIAGFFAAMLIAAFGIIPRLIFRRESKFRDEYALTFAEDGIHFRTDHIDSQLQWDLYSWALIASHSFVLYYGASSFTVIPKRVFQSSGEQKVFEELLALKVQRIIRKG